MAQRRLLFSFILFSLIGFFQIALGQNTIDSLKLLLRDAKTVNRKMELYAYIGQNYYMNSPDSALKYTTTGIEIGDQEIESRKDSTYYNYLSTLLNNAAFINQKKGNYYKSILLYQRSIDAFGKLSMKNEAVTANLNLGTLYFDIGEYDLAFNLLEKVRKQLGKDDGVALANCQLTLGSIYVIRGKEESGLNNFYSAMALFQSNNYFSGEGRALNKIGEVFLARRDYLQAMENFRNALFNFSKEDDLRGMSESKYFIAKLKLLNGEKDSANYYAQEALKEAQQMNYPKNLRDVSLLLYSIYAAQGNYKDALSMHLLYSQMDSLLTVQDAIKITAKEQLEADFENRTQLLEKEQAKKDAISQEALKRQKLISFVSFGGGILLLLLLVLAIRNYRTKQKANIEISIQKKVVETKNKEILDSINYANRIQQTLLAHEDLLKANLPEHFVLFRPKDIVSGDFYWATEFDHSFYMAICDSTGHGVPGAFMSLLNISFLNEAINEKKISEPGEIFNQTRKRLIAGVSKDGAQDGMDGILFRFDQRKKQLSYVAAHNVPLVIRHNTLIRLDADKMPVGKSPKETTPFTTHSFKLESGDLVLAFTDGIADQFGGPKGKKLKYKPLEEFILQRRELPLPQLKIELEKFFDDWKGTLEQVDDVLFFCLCVE